MSGGTVAQGGIDNMSGPGLNAGGPGIEAMSGPGLMAGGAGIEKAVNAQPMGDLLVEILATAADRFTKIAGSMLAKGASAVATGVNNMASSAAAPFKPDFTPDSSPRMASTNAQSVGQEKQRSIDAPPSPQVAIVVPTGIPNLNAGKGAGLSC